MSDQLSFLEPSANKTDASKKPQSSVKKKSPQDQAVQTRINTLIEEKASQEKLRANLEAQENNPQEIKTQEASTQEQPVQKIYPKQEVQESNVIPNEPEVMTVSDLNRSIRGLLEKNYSFLWVQGEISNFKIPSSGHMYFTLKDSKSQIRAVMFKGFAQTLKFKPEDGMEVLVRCRVTAYEPRGDYQLFCEVMEPVGFGALQVAFEKLKEKLKKEGLFDQARKKTIPAFPSKIGIVTSPTGAVIRDMLNILSRRFGGGLDITIFPVSVQGDKASGEIVKAINLANKMGTSRFDVLIVGRGGGSLEDLWAFNIEEVARAVSSSKIPTISAVGHEVDFTICDFVADLRAPTPSAAAELVVKNKADLIDRVNLLQRHGTQQMVKRLQLLKIKLLGTQKRLIDPKRKLQDLMLRCDDWSNRLTQNMERYFQDCYTNVKFLRERLGSPEKRLQLAQQALVNKNERLENRIWQLLRKKQTGFAGFAALLNGLSPLAILERGYSIVKKGEQIITKSAQVKTGDRVQIQLADGELSSQIL